MIRFGDYTSFLYGEFQRSTSPRRRRYCDDPDASCTRHHSWCRHLVAALGQLRPIKKIYLNLKYAVFEIKLPKETQISARDGTLSPCAPQHFRWRSAQNVLARRSRPWYSLELASIEGQVKFYIWSEEGRQIGLMAALYAQFPRN
jgi:hypothetical protein